MRVKSKDRFIIYALILLSSLLISYMPLSIGASVTAASGSASDIQVAINDVASQGGGEVHIPSGTFDFATGSWQTVTVPSGVSIFGAPTQRDANGQVISWGTVLRMPFDATPDEAIWFNIRGDNVRVSDIKIVGYREIDPSNGRHYRGFDIRNSANFRIDHCYLRNICGKAVLTSNANGVVDHNLFVNDPYHVVGGYSGCSVWYGVAVDGDDTTWEPNIADVLGHYTFRTVFIEDNYFEGWRHTVAAGRGAHYVYRYNTERENGYGTIDGHGHEGYLSTRCIEAYNNDFGGRSTATDSNTDGSHMGVQLRGGGGVFFDNIVDGYGLNTGALEYSAFVCMVQYTPNDYPDEQIKDVWIWGNQLTPAGSDLYDVAIGTIAPGSQIREGYEFYLQEPEQTSDGFTYTPYQYPHPLVTGDPIPEGFWNINIVSTPTEGGTTSPTGLQNVQVGTSITVTASPNLNYSLSYWVFDGANYGSTSTIVIPAQVQNSTHSLEAVFGSSANGPPPTTYTVTIASSPNGTTTPSVGTYTYNSSEQITLTATPNSDYRFNYWTVSGTTYTDNPLAITVTSDLTVSASFSLESEPPPEPPDEEPLEESPLLYTPIYTPFYAVGLIVFIEATYRWRKRRD